ncbi:MAG: hypothetical protein OXC30_06255 [Alphaproteobacteria bacterium]|nr:hypothetical protein [Alphaproteobacteria bacterium]
MLILREFLLFFMLGGLAVAGTLTGRSSAPSLQDPAHAKRIDAFLLLDPKVVHQYLKQQNASEEVLRDAMNLIKQNAVIEVLRDAIRVELLHRRYRASLEAEMNSSGVADDSLAEVSDSSQSADDIYLPKRESASAQHSAAAVVNGGNAGQNASLSKRQRKRIRRQASSTSGPLKEEGDNTPRSEVMLTIPQKGDRNVLRESTDAETDRESTDAETELAKRSLQRRSVLRTLEKWKSTTKSPKQQREAQEGEGKAREEEGGSMLTTLEGVVALYTLTDSEKKKAAQILKEGDVDTKLEDHLALFDKVKRTARVAPLLAVFAKDQDFKAAISAVSVSENFTKVLEFLHQDKVSAVVRDLSTKRCLDFPQYAAVHKEFIDIMMRSLRFTHAALLHMVQNEEPMMPFVDMCALRIMRILNVNMEKAESMLRTQIDALASKTDDVLHGWLETLNIDPNKGSLYKAKRLMAIAGESKKLRANPVKSFADYKNSVYALCAITYLLLKENDATLNDLSTHTLPKKMQAKFQKRRVSMAGLGTIMRTEWSKAKITPGTRNGLVNFLNQHSVAVVWTCWHAMLWISPGKQDRLTDALNDLCALQKAKTNKDFEKIAKALNFFQDSLDEAFGLSGSLQALLFDVI